MKFVAGTFQVPSANYAILPLASKSHGTRSVPATFENAP